MAAKAPKLSFRTLRHRSWWSTIALLCIAAVIGHSGTALANDTLNDQSSLTETIARLEKRVYELERKLQERQPEPPNFPDPEYYSATSQDMRMPNEIETPLPEHGGSSPEPVSAEVPILASPPSAPPAALGTPEDMDALRDLMVIRNEAVTVPKGKLDIGAQVQYVRADNLLQFSRAVLASGSVRYGLWNGVEISGVVPYYYAYRSSQLYPGAYEETEIIDWGDVSGQLTVTLVRESLDRPAIFGYVGGAVPTGPLPYTLNAGDAKANPIDPLYFFQNAGHYSGIVGVTIAKTVEPLVFFTGFNYTTFASRTVTGSEYQPADRYGFNFGFGLAISERTTLGAKAEGVYQGAFTFDGEEIMGWDAESVGLTFSLTQRLAPSFFLEPFVTIGMTSDLPGASIGLSARKSY